MPVSPFLRAWERYGFQRGRGGGVGSSVSRHWPDIQWPYLCTAPDFRPIAGIEPRLIRHLPPTRRN